MHAAQRVLGMNVRCRSGYCMCGTPLRHQAAAISSRALSSQTYFSQSFLARRKAVFWREERQRGRQPRPRRRLEEDLISCVTRRTRHDAVAGRADSEARRGVGEGEEDEDARRGGSGRGSRRRQTAKRWPGHDEAG